jgi:hypothetical protein
MFISQNERAGLSREARVEAMRLRERHGVEAESVCNAEFRRSRIFTKRRLFWRSVMDVLSRTNR